MPNWCHNRVTVSFNDSSKSAEVLELFKAIDKDNRPTLFEKVLPVPNNLTSAAEYNWRCDNWGCKWSPRQFDFTVEDCDYIEVEFDTPWSPASGICEALRDKYDDMNFTWFYDEPGMQFCGYL
tara:strand:- start:33 stop:401 length:369 start_codon:yes stop_codon:yes gene_type:complete